MEKYSYSKDELLKDLEIKYQTYTDSKYPIYVKLNNNVAKVFLIIESQIFPCLDFIKVKVKIVKELQDVLFMLY